MDNNNQYNQYSKSNQEILEQLKKQNEARMADTMKMTKSYSPSMYFVERKPVTDAELKEARTLHDNGVAGDTAAVRTACDLLKKLHSQDPANYKVEAYLGSATALMGRDELNVMDRMKLAKRGLKMLDHAVVMAPEDIEIRTLRGHVCFNLPEMYFQRSKTAIEDFSYIAARYEKDSRSVEKGYYCELLYKIGVANRYIGRQQDAEAAWNKLLTVSKDQKYLGLLAKFDFKP